MLPAMAVDEETTASARGEEPALYTEKLTFRRTKNRRKTQSPDRKTIPTIFQQRNAGRTT